MIITSIVTATIPADMKRDLKKAAAKHDLTASEIIRSGLEQKLKELKSLDK